MCTLMGYTESEMAGRDTRAVLFDTEEYDRIDRELYQPLPEKGRTCVETTFRKKDGTAIRVILTAAMLRAEDPAAGCVVTVHDVTDRTRAEAALRESEDRFRSMMEQSPFSIQVLSPRGDTVAVNKAFEKLWGVTAESLRGYNILRDAQIESLGFMPIVRSAFSGEQVKTPVVDYDIGVTLGAGERRTVLGVFYPIRDAAGAISSVILIHQDLTERIRAERVNRRLEEQLQQAMKMEAIGRLAGGSRARLQQPADRHPRAMSSWLRADSEAGAAHRRRTWTRSRRPRGAAGAPDAPAPGLLRAGRSSSRGWSA